jgi:phosphoglycolate phosphatase-like HAD superfamily hydrolase
VKPSPFPLIDAVVFDCDGVLLDSMLVKTEAFGELFRAWGDEAAEMMVRYHVDNGGMGRYEKFKYFFRHYLNRDASDRDIKDLDGRYRELALEKVLASPFVPGALEFISTYGEKLPLAVASGTPQQELEDVLKARDIAQHFQRICGTPPPKDVSLAHFVRDSSLDKGRVLMIGDSTTDREAAEIVGTPFLGIGEATGAEDWIPDLTGLEAYLRQDA